jgi:hypothetical protein
MNVALALQQCIDAYAREDLIKLDVYKAAEEGILTPGQLSYYLRNLGWIMNETFGSIEMAAAESFSRSRPLAGEYFAKKLREEVGHGTWAREDAERLEGDFSFDRSGHSPSEAALSLLRLQKHHIKVNPTLFLTYIFFAEYLTVVVGPEWMRLLTEKCGFDRRHFGVIDTHAELDKDHTKENMIDMELLSQEAGLGRDEMIGALEDYIGAYSRIFSDLPRDFGDSNVIQTSL